MKRLAIPLIFLLSLPGLTAQELPPGGQMFGLDTMAQQDQVDFITQNFYEIYSQGFEEAIALSNYAREISQANHWAEEEAYAFMCLGMTTYLHGDYDKALEAYLRSSDIFDSLQNLEGIAKLNNELAIFYRKHQQLDKVHECLDKSESAARRINNMETLGTSLHHRGTTLSQLGAFEKALPYFQQVLEIRKQLHDSVGLSYIYLDFAEYELQKARPEKAFGYIAKSTAIRKKLNDRQGVAVNETIKGETYFALGRYEQAIPFFQKAIDLATPIGYVDLIRYTHNMMRESYLKLDDFANAYASLQNLMVFKDSLFNIEKTKAIQQLQVKHETQKKEQQIALQAAELQSTRYLTAGLGGILILIILMAWMQRNRMQLKYQKELEKEKTRTREAQIEAALASQEAERKRFARDLHDGFGQLISVLNLNLKSLETNKANRQEVFENSEKVLEQMYHELKAICFNLMPETLIKQGLVDALQEFALRINKSGKLSILVDTFGMDQRLEDLQEISLYRITQEWINNVIKYSDANKITLSLTRDHEEITLLIEDDGSGFEKYQLTQGKGNGWRNINSRTNLIHGEIDLDTHPERRGNTLVLNAPFKVLSIQKTSEAAAARYQQIDF